jgi:dTDP-glucose 4,6-dehydratase
MRVVVTGGAGFIGSAFVRRLVGQISEGQMPDDEVVVLDALTYAGNVRNLADVRDRIELVHGDVCDREVVDVALAGADAVVHFAAESHVTRSEKDPDLFQRTNVEGTLVLLETAVRHGVDRFVHVSTDEVYGDALGSVDFAEGAKEVGDHQATSAYAKSKSRADDLAASFRDVLDVRIVRPTNNFGPFQFPEKALPRWITRVLRDEAITLWGEGDQIRDWLYVDDTAEAIDLVLRRAPARSTYNIGACNEPEIRNRDVAHWLLGRYWTRGARIEHQLDRREHHDGRYRVDVSAIHALGWRRATEVWAGVEATCRWYEANRDWWEPLVREAERIYR